MNEMLVKYRQIGDIFDHGIRILDVDCGKG